MIYQQYCMFAMFPRVSEIVLSLFSLEFELAFSNAAVY